MRTKKAKRITNIGRMGPKDLIVFDLDGTLAETKSPMDQEMTHLLGRLLDQKKVAVIGGGRYALFKEQFLRPLDLPAAEKKRLFLFPTTATVFYRYARGWKKVYAHELRAAEKKRIRAAFRAAFKEVGYEQPKKTYGRVIEDRGTQMTFSALGQDVVKILGKKKGVALKNKWRYEHTKTKLAIAKVVGRLLPGLEVRAAGHTSIDVTKKGIDKAYGLHQMETYLKVKIRHMLFIGDAIFPGGNDYAALKTGVDYIPVEGPEETKKIIRKLLERNH